MFRIADLVDFVLEGHRDAPALIQRTAVIRRLDRLLPGKIAGRQDGAQVTLTRHEVFSVILPYLIAAFPQGGKRLFKELLPRCADRVVPLVSRIFHEIDFGRKLSPDECHQGVGFHFGNPEGLRQRLGRKLERSAEGCQQEHQTNPLFHRASTYLRTSIPYSSSEMLRLNRFSSAATCRRMSFRCSGNRFRIWLLLRTGMTCPDGVSRQ